MKTNNLLLLSDSYKFNHWAQYPEITEAVMSYFESRLGAKFQETVWVGLQYILEEYFVGQVVTRDKIEEAAILSQNHFGDNEAFNREGWEHILNEYNGYLPLRIRSVPEGTPVTINNVMMTIENLGGEKTKWLTNFSETILTHVWFPSTVATLSREVKKMCKRELDNSCDLPEDVKSIILSYMLHDFGFRGTSSNESAGIGGFAHLANFMGTDTVIAMLVARDYYGADPEFKNIAHSVRATEHSVMTSLGEDGEKQVLENFIRKNPQGIISCVADSYNIERFINEYVRDFKDLILARQPNANGVCKFVVRPDSLRFEGDTPEDQMVWILDQLWEIFGGTVNTLGKKVLNPCCSTLWGDGIDIYGIEKILIACVKAGYSVESLVFGMGGGLLQKVNRDTQRNAFKCCAQMQAGKWVDVKKNPLDTSKASKGGRLALIRGTIDNEFYTVREEGIDESENLLQITYEMGRILKRYTLDDIRENAKL